MHSPILRHPGRRLLSAVALIFSMLLLGGCNKTREVSRVDPTRVRDLDYRFDDDDARMVADTMITSCLDGVWLAAFDTANERRPVIIVGTVRNQTSDYIDTGLFIKQIERAFVDSGRIRVVAAPTERVEVRDERREGQEFNREETVKRMAYELGADYMMIGRVGETAAVSRNKKRRTQYYQINLELIDIESNEKAWIGEHQIEKWVQDRN